MRIHTDKLNPHDLWAALAMVSPHADMELTSHGSRTHLRAYEVHLWWNGPKVKGDGRAHTNTGNQGAGAYALTWDEWGWFIDRLYEIDPSARIGSYNDREHFYQVTERESKRVQQYGNPVAKRTHQAGWLPWRQPDLQVF